MTLSDKCLELRKKHDEAVSKYLKETMTTCPLCNRALYKDNIFLWKEMNKTLDDFMEVLLKEVPCNALQKK